MRFILLLFLLFPVVLIAQGEELIIARHHFGIDDHQRLIVCRADLATANAAATESFTTIKAGNTFTLVHPVLHPASADPHQPFSVDSRRF
jgi:hypothetical protein